MKMSAAHARVAIAVRQGQLARLDGTIQCTDCEKPATQYDHRDYLKPLEVYPVCRGCNRRRGTAANHMEEDRSYMVRVNDATLTRLKQIKKRTGRKITELVEMAVLNLRIGARGK